MPTFNPDLVRSLSDFGEGTLSAEDIDYADRYISRPQAITRGVAQGLFVGGAGAVVGSLLGSALGAGAYAALPKLRALADIHAPGALRALLHRLPQTGMDPTRVNKLLRGIELASTIGMGAGGAISGYRSGVQSSIENQLNPAESKLHAIASNLAAAAPFLMGF